MNVINGFVEWKPGYDTRPNLHVVIEGTVPSLDEYVFQSDKDRSFWWAEKDGFYRYFSGHPDRPGDGFGGSTYTLNTQDGTVTLKGPYSSRAGVVNGLGHGPCVDVRIHEEGKNGRTVGNTALALEHAEEAADRAGVSLLREEDGLFGGGYAYTVRETYPSEWAWDGEENEDRIMPYGDGTFHHSDGARIEVQKLEWVEENNIRKTKERSITAYRAVLWDSDGERVEEAINTRPDIAYHYLMAVHADRKPPGKAGNAPSKTQDYQKRLERAEITD